MVPEEKKRNALILLLQSVTDFILPRICPSCRNNLTGYEKYICNNCRELLRPPGKNLISFEYTRKFKDKGIISGFNSAFVFEKGGVLQNIIHSIKYGSRFMTAAYLGELTAKALQKEIADWGINIIVPVPLHKAKTAARGYNQSYYIAKGLSRASGIQWSSRILKRKKFTETQTTMTLEQREANVKNAFTVKNTTQIRGKNILLADDVITTGATINECGRILKSNGAGKVFAVSAALAGMEVTSFRVPQHQESKDRF